MIRPAVLEDLPQIERVYEAARAFMAANGNPHQWGDSGYPKPELLKSDIQKRQLFAVEENGSVHGVFAFMLGEDPTYGVIDGGHWLNDLPYGTIHRIAGDGKVKGLLRQALAFALTQTSQVRADTHHDNLPMQRALSKNGFIRCGIIYLENGDPRIAYHYCSTNLIVNSDAG